MQELRPAICAPLLALACFGCSRQSPPPHHPSNGKQGVHIDSSMLPPAQNPAQVTGADARNASRAQMHPSRAPDARFDFRSPHFDLWDFLNIYRIDLRNREDLRWERRIDADGGITFEVQGISDQPIRVSLPGPDHDPRSEVLEFHSARIRIHPPGDGSGGVSITWGKTAMTSEQIRGKS